MFNKKILIISTAIIAFLIGMQSVSAATWPVHDAILPTSSFDIPIETVEDQRVDDMCMEWNLSYAVYSGAQLSYKVYSAPKAQHQIFTKASKAYVYGQMPLGLSFPIVSNFIPKNGTPSIGSKIYIYQNEGGILLGNSETERGEISTQISIMAVFRSLNPLSTIRTPYQYFYVKTAGAAPITFSDSTFKDNFIYPTDQPLYGCNNYYTAYCGDGVIDKKNGNESTDGQGGIDTNDSDVGFLTWNIAPVVDEVCDDGEQNGQPGKCKTDCTGIGGGTPGGPTCTLVAANSTIEAGQTTTLSASYTSGTSASFTPAISGITFTYPTRTNTTISVSPTTTTTYTLNVNGAGGTSIACPATVTVTQPQAHLTCNLSFSQNPVVPGQIVNVGWNVTNGNFVGTYINVNPSIAGWPHAVNSNQYNGVTQAIPSHTGDYLFSFLIFNNDNTQTTTCTGLLHVIQKTPAKCSMTTTTPLISAGGTALINAQYSNSVLTTISPNIAGLNFVYPNRSKNNIEVHPTTTTTYTMIVGNSFGEQSKCGVKINVINTGMVINKTLVNDINYRSGDLVTFKITFANHGPTTVDNVVLTDMLPAGLQYVSSQLYGAAPYTFGTGINQNNMFVQYSGFSLTPGQEGYMMIVGRFKGYQYANQTLNVSSLKSDTSQPIYSSALFQAYVPMSNATITKIADKTTYYPGQDGLFTLAVTNNGPDAINTIKITDYRPQNTSCVSADSHRYANVPLAMTNAMNPYTRTYTGTLNVGETIYLYLTGHMSNDPACIGAYVNNAAISYMVNGTVQTGAAPEVPFAISTTPASVMDFEKRIIQYGNNSGDPVVFELLYHNNGSATITHFEVVDYWPGTLNFVSATPISTTQIPSEGGSIIRWIFNTPLAPDGSGKIIINGTIK